MDKVVEETVKKCIPSQASYPGHSQREPLCPTPLPSEHWSEIAVDFAGLFPSGHYVLVAIDEHSRYPEVEVISSTPARVVIPRLNDIFASQGFPKVVKTDNGRPFQISDFKDFANQAGFRHRKITPFWPEANGDAERFMRTLNKYVRAVTAECKDWRIELPDFLRQYIATPHGAANISLFEALTGRKMNIGIPAVPKFPTNLFHSRLAHNDAVSKMEMKNYADQRRHTRDSDIRTGDHVLVKQRKRNKLTPLYDPHPYSVVKKHGSLIVARRDNHFVTRNSSFFKPVQIDVPSEEEEEEEVDEANQFNSQPETVTPKTVSQSQTPARGQAWCNGQHVCFSSLPPMLGAPRGVTVSMSAFLACHQYQGPRVV